MNLNYNNYRKMCIFDNCKAMSETSFYKHRRSMQQKVISMLNCIFSNNLFSIATPIIVSIDTRWSSRGWTANEATTSCFLCGSNGENKLLFVYNVIKRGKDANFSGSSKSMEREGTLQIINQLEMYNINVTHYVHDDDSQSRSLFSLHFPSSIELIDRLHKLRSFRRRFFKLITDNKLKKSGVIEKLMK